MSKRYVLICILLLIGTDALAQNIFMAIIQDHEEKEPLAGVTAYIPSLSIGNISDVNGQIIISKIPDGTHDITFSYVGFETLTITRIFPLDDSLQNQIIYLHPSHEEMEEVVITSTRSSRTVVDIPTRVEFIAGEELAEKGNMKPGDIRMLLNESTGIQTQQTSATSYNSSIRIQGLDGKYTQLLRDGLPLYSGFSGGLSLMQIAPLDLKQVEVIKGASSTLYGAGAIAGLVNLVTKSPKDTPELSFMFNGTSALGLDASGFYSNKFGKLGTTIFTSYNKGTPYDPADIGLTAIPRFDRFTFNPRLFIFLNDRTEMNMGVNFIKEDRLGGNIDYVEDNEVVDPYFERNQTERISSQFRLRHRLPGNTQIETKNSLNIYDRTIEIPGFIFSGRQFSSFSEANFSTSGVHLEWVAGLNLWTDKFDQSAGSEDQDLGFSEATFGSFIQNVWSMNEKWTLESGFRADYQSEYGFFPLPKVSLMFEPYLSLTFRLGGGLGYKTPTAFSEDAERLQFRNIMPIDTDDLKAEQSYGGSFDINYRLAVTNELIFNTNTLFFYTQITDPLVLTPIDSVYEFQQPDGYVDTKGVEVNMTWSYQDLKLFIGYTYADVKQHNSGADTAFPLVSKHRLNNVLMFEKHGRYWIGLEAYYFSPQKLSDGGTGQSYWIVGLMTEKKFGPYLSLFLNFENFTDTRQTAFDTIFTGDLSNPQFRDIYAPLDGFVINGGIKLKF